MPFTVFHRTNLQVLPLIVGFGTSTERPKQPFLIYPNAGAIHKAKPEHGLTELIEEQGPVLSGATARRESLLALTSFHSQETATHSSILAWRSPWTKELGRLQSMGLQRVGHN